jgi:hypothetical protein
MFTVIMLICSLNTQEGCIGVTDDYGPYTSYTRCINRAVVMRNYAHATFPIPINVTYGCKKIGEIT